MRPKGAAVAGARTRGWKTGSTWTTSFADRPQGERPGRRMVGRRLIREIGTAGPTAITPRARPRAHAGLEQI